MILTIRFYQKIYFASFSVYMPVYADLFHLFYTSIGKIRRNKGQLLGNQTNFKVSPLA